MLTGRCVSDLDTTTPLHHTVPMRLTINLDDELYGVARSLARAEDITISEALNRFVRRALAPSPGRRPRDKTGLPSSPCKRSFGPDDVADHDLGLDLGTA